jgi:DNA polymerase V
MSPAIEEPCLNTAPVPLQVTAVLITRLEEQVRAGFPSPAEDMGASRIDVLAHLILHPAATYSMTVRGDSMKEFGIFDHDTLLVDRAIRPKHGHIVVANLDNEFVCKLLWKRNGAIKLKAGNPTYPDIVPKDDQILQIWGVVLTSIKKFQI